MTSPSTLALAQDEKHISALTHRLRDLLYWNVGYVDAMCRESAVILAYRLIRDGYDAVITSGFDKSPESIDLYGEYGEGHVFVRCGDKLYDPTREQFHPDYTGRSPMRNVQLVFTLEEGAAIYGQTPCNDKGWHPPHRPTVETAKAFLYHSICDITNERISTVCRKLDCPELAL